MESKKVSNNMLARTLIYLNYIKSLPQNTKNISATKIAGALGLGEVSVRKDLAKLSDGGRCKMGYQCHELIEDIENFLEVKNTMNAVVIGKGDMQQLLLEYTGFEAAGLNIVAGFDLSCSKKRNFSGKSIYPMNRLEGFFNDQDIKIGIIMVPEEEAQEVCDKLVSLGVEGIWNFTPVHLNVPSHVVLQNECLALSIAKLRIQMKERNAADL